MSRIGTLLCALGIGLLFCSISAGQDNYALKLDGDSAAAMINTADGGNALLLYGNRLRKIDSTGKKIWQKVYKSDSIPISPDRNRTHEYSVS